jgi:hypothetical protein
MADDKSGRPHTRSSPGKHGSTTTESDRPREAGPEDTPRRDMGDESDGRGGRMPRGADEPGAGL